MCSGALSSGDVLDDVAALVAERNRLDVRLARLVRAAELSQAPERDGLKSVSSWLQGHCRLTGAVASKLVRVGRAGEHLPVLAEAAEAGWVSGEQVAEAAAVVTPKRIAAAAAAGVDLGEIDAILTGVAVERPHDALVLAVAHYLAALDPDGPEPDPTEGRSLTLVTHPDGTVTLTGRLDPVGGEKVRTAVEAHVQADRPAGDTRTRAQRQADGLVQVADNALAAGRVPVLRTVKPHVVVRIDLDDLAAGAGVGQLGSDTIVSAARARWLACDGGITRIVFGPDRVPLDVGREQRLVTGPLRRAVEARDGGCVFTGCTAPTTWCDVHHPATSRGPRRACESWGGGGPYTHQGPPRLPRGATTHRPMAHLAARRHRDHRSRTTPPCSGLRRRGRRSPRPARPRRGRGARRPAARVTAGDRRSTG